MELNGSIVALVTPMTKNGEIDDEALAGLIEWHIASGTRGLVIAGTTGESPTLTTEEHARLLRRSVDLARGRITIIAGTGSNSTAQTLALSQRAEQDGANALMLVVPYYNKPPQAGLIAHFSKIADAVKLPVVLYNVPSRTVVDLLPATVEKLARVSNIVGIKEASARMDRVAELRQRCGPDFLLYSGDDGSAAAFMLAGGNGVISVTANVAPDQMSALATAAVQGQVTKVRQIDHSLGPLHRALFVESNPIPVKWALHKMGRIGSGIRSPLVPLSSVNQNVVESAMRQSGIWNG